MDVRRVMLFRTVAREGSMSAASRVLGSTQPNVSQQLRLLEREVGTPLIIRSSRGVTLTEAGAALQARADAIASQLHLAGEELTALANLNGGRVRVAGFPSAAASLIPSAFQALASTHPNLVIGLLEAEPEESREAVLAGDVDCAVVFSYDAPPIDTGELSWTPLFVEPMFLVAPLGSAARRGDMPLAKWLAEATWIAGCPDCRRHLVDCCRQVGFLPALVHESDDCVVAQNLVARGMGVSVMPQLAIRIFRHPEVEVELAAAFGSRHIGVIYWSGAEEVPGIRAVLDQLQVESIRLQRSIDFR